ncbi:MAG TPA: alpha/beta hydrolase [Pyrinomonadaceae bacterium]
MGIWIRTVRLVLLLVLAPMLVQAQTEPQARELKVAPHVFESSSGEKIDAQFGELTVPENRKKTGSRLIQLAFVRFKSTSPNPGPPIVYLAGGPGGSGIAAARGTRFPLFMAMRQVADVIALDQRGVGLSKPNLLCRETVSISPHTLHTRDEVLEVFRKQSAACRVTFERQGIDLSGYNTNESADDLEDLRKAIGAKKISLWGISYGTHLALATVKLHPKSVDRMILAGIEGPAHTIKLPSNIQNHLEHLDRLVKADPYLSKDIPSFLGLVSDVLKRLERQPVTVEVTDPNTKQPIKVSLNKFAIQMLTVWSFGNAEGALPARYYALSRGDYSIAALGWVDFTRSRSVGSAMSYMMDCTSGISKERRTRVARESRTTLLEDLMDFPFPDVCSAWGNPDAGDWFRSPAKSTVPTLFISGTLDVRTPPSNAEEVRRGFVNSSHLIIDGAVHSDPLFLSSPGIQDVMLEFMNGRKIATTTIALAPLKFTPVSPAARN